MRILRSIRSVNPVIGGPVESVKQSSAVLQARGHTVEIVSLDGPNESWVQDFPLTVHALGPGRGTYGYAPKFTPWLRARAHSYDAVIVHGVWQYNSFGVWRGLRQTATPYYVFPHGMLDPWFKRTYPVKHLKKLFYWPWADYRVLRDATAVLFTSEAERTLARESFRLYRCNEKVVNYGTAAPNCDLSKARELFLARFPHLRGKRLFLFLSRLHEKKGCDLLVKAFAQVVASFRGGEPLHLVLAGPASSDACEQQLKYLVESAFGNGESVAAVTFCGMLSGELKWGAFAAAEVFTLPSHQENFGISVAEALATGLPALISNRVNIWREIEADGAGFADDDDLAGTTRLLERWLALSPDERADMRSKALRCFATRFEIQRATDSLLRVLGSPSNSDVRTPE